MHSHLATEVFNYEKATILNDYVCRRVNHMTLAIGQEYDVRKLIYDIGNSRHIIASKTKR